MEGPTHPSVWILSNVQHSNMETSGNFKSYLPELKSGPCIFCGLRCGSITMTFSACLSLEVGPLTMILFLPVKLGYWSEVRSLFPSS